MERTITTEKVMIRSNIPMLFAAALLLSGCALMDPASPGAAAYGDEPPIVTNATSYVLQPQGGGYKADISIRFTNQSDQRMYIVNCHNALAPVLEKRVGGEWVPWWSPVLAMCLTPPIVIRPGETLERDLWVWGAMPNTNQGPQWASTDLAGTYRIVLTSVVYNYNDRGQGFGQAVPVELRVSNEFDLRY